MLFDTDLFIYIERGNAKAADMLNAEEERFLSIQTYMELLQGAKSKEQHKRVKRFIADMGFVTLPITENIGHRALIYVEQHTLSGGLYAGNALIAATAVENNLVLCSSNEKHFKCIQGLELKVFRP